MPGVQVELRPGGRIVTTTAEGRFQLKLRPGVYMVRIFTDFYAPTRLEDVEVRAGEITYLPDVTMTMDDGEMLDTVVSTFRADTNSEATQLQVRRQSAAVRDAVSAEEISRSGDGSASSAARRVVATQIRDDYLYVRGLGGRYTNVLLDDTLQPQLDPDIPGVQLDLFPSSVLSSIAVVKSYTVDLPGAFGGGTMLLSTRDYPEELTFGVKLGMEYNSATTFRDAPIYHGGRFDLLGFDDGTRALPEGVRGVRLDRLTLAPEERDQLATSFNDDMSVGSQRVGIMPLSSIGLSLGGTVDLPGSAELGYLALAGWSLDRQLNTDATVGRGTLGEDGVSVEGQDNFDRIAYSAEAQLTALGKVTLQLDEDHDLTLSTLFNQIGEDFTGIDVGVLQEFDSVRPSYRSRYRWNQRTYSHTQLTGNHFLGDTELRWRGAINKSRYYEPDTRDFRFAPGDAASSQAWPSGFWGDDRRFFWNDRQPVDAQRLFFDLETIGATAAADLTWDYDQLGDYEIQIGGMIHTEHRDFSLRRFEYDRARRATLDQVDDPPSSIFLNENYADVWRLNENTLSNDGYTAQQDTFAIYAATQLRPVSWLRLYGGVRVEAFRQQLQPSSPFAAQDGANPEPESESPASSVFRTDVDPLPVGSAVFQLPKENFIRASYSATVARPRSRELSPVLVPDFIRNRTLKGSPDVRRTRIQNFDLRWEYFPGATEVIAVTGFAKLFTDPIELVLVNPNRLVAYENTDSARNIGFEVEARIGLDRIADSLGGLTVGGNFTYVYSRVKLTPEQAMAVTNAERPLNGQSPWVANLSLGYDPEDRPFGVYLFYNVFGPRLEEVGTNGLPDSYQQPFHSLDLTARWNVTDHLELSLKGKNLLNQRQSLNQRDFVVRSYNDGVSISLGASLTY